MHPSETEGMTTEDIKELKELSQGDKIVAVGESGWIITGKNQTAGSRKNGSRHRWNLQKM